MAVVSNLANKACYAVFVSKSQIGNRPKETRKAAACAQCHVVSDTAFNVPGFILFHFVPRNK